MIRPVKMKRFYVAVPHNKEEDVAEVLGKLGVVEVFSEKSQVIRGDEVIETYATFLRIADRTKLAYDTIIDLLPKREEKPSFNERLKNIFSLPEREKKLEKVSVKDLIESIKFYEKQLGIYTNRLDNLRKRLSEINDLLTKVNVFKKNAISLDTLGEYTHIFVKAGFIPEVNIDRLKEALKPFNVILTVLEGRLKDKFILVAASQKDKENILSILTMLNMEEIMVPRDVEPDPEKAYSNLLEERKKILTELSSLKNEVEVFLQDISPKKRYIRFMYNVRSMSLKTRNFSVFYGWVPSEKLEGLKSMIKEITNGLMHIEAVDPDPNSDIKPPTYLKSPPIIDKFQLIVKMRGVLSYYEIDPTILFAIFFSIMYGMMFGDVGQGIVLFILGLIFNRIKRPFLGMSYNALNKLGAILSTASIFSIIFGFLYGESFLLHFMNPIWLDPLKSPIEISVVSIIFGLVQIVVGLILNIINDLLNRDYFTALLSWKGIVGLVYYLVGILLSIRFIIGGMKLGALASPENLPLVAIELGLLTVGFLKSFIENIIKKHGGSMMDTLMEGVGDLIEMFISYLTNSISYVRLGAFAVAHVALAEVAYILAPSMGFWPSFITFNILVIILEGFSAGIQSIRLIFYEFSTKFYRDEGRIFKPLHI